ncbi:hypothetical protein ACP4OV_007983 [Aristida adscensionis]
MGALSASTSAVNWLVEDDILLKNAVEAGASLESLAKGAVCFSRKFTIQEIQDRWNALLYDPEISIQASSRMAEYENELSASDPAKAHKIFNTKAKDFSFQKRKIDSVKNLYYAMRKRICNEPCDTSNLGFLVSPCSCIASGRECVCGGLAKLSQGHHVDNNIEPGLSSMSRYEQVGPSYNGGHVYPELNGHFRSRHTEGMIRNGDATNNVSYSYSDVGQIYEHHAYAAKTHGNSEGNSMSLKGITDFQDTMQFEQLDSNHCGNGLAESKALVISNHVGVEHAHFNGNMQESLQVIAPPEGSQAPGGAVWSGAQENALTHADDRKIKSVNRDSLTFQATLDGGICTPGLDHSEIPESDFMDFQFFSNSEDFDILNGENFLNSPSEANQEDLDDPAVKVVPGVESTVQNLVHSNEANMSCEQIDPCNLENNVVDVSGTILVPTSLEVPCPGRFVECVLNTEDPDIPCNDDVLTPDEYPLQCTTSTIGQNSEDAICSVSPAASPQTNNEHSKASDLAQIKGEDMANVQPSSQTMNPSPSMSEQKEGSMPDNKGGVLGAKPSEGPSTADVPAIGKIDISDANTCMLALPTFSAAGFAEASPCDLGQRESFDNSHGIGLQTSVQLPDQMQFRSHDNQTEMVDDAARHNCIPSNALSDLGIQDPVATVSTPAQAEECSENENDVPNYYDIEALILDQDLIPWDQDSDLMHPEGVTLGRETEHIKVDIDLGKEGRANKISRRQAVIKMDETGSFHIKNIGKYPIFVNSKEIPSCKRINLSSDSLIEIKDMRFIFHVYQAAVRQYIARVLNPGS